MRQLFAIVVAFSSVSLAEPIAVTNYSVTDATMSGFGGWAHTFTGTITPTGAFTNFGQLAQRANYVEGSGTLNDGIVGSSPLNTQLFVVGDADGTLINPVVTLKLGKLATINTIRIFGGQFDFNALPGQITGVTVELNGQALTVNTIPAGYVNIIGVSLDDIIDLRGTSLADVATDTIVLRDFVTGPTGRQFSMTELRVDGAPYVPPTPVEIDVKPGSKKNPVVGRPEGVVKVALLSSPTFDPLTVDVYTLTFGKTGKETSLLSCDAFPADFNRDGLDDLLCEFSFGTTGLAVGDTSATLFGKVGTTTIVGTDAIDVRPTDDEPGE